jgi:hypothetical protein
MSRGVTSSIVKRTVDGYSVLRVESILETPYVIHTLIDTKYEEHIMMIRWNRHSGKKYLTGEINNNNHEELINKLKLPYEHGSKVLLHRLVMDLSKIPNPENFAYVDHIDRQTFDNREKNLRWASQSLQNHNRDTRTRVNIPEDIDESEIPKYILWYDVVENNLRRKFFKIEKHPALTKPWSGTKKAKISNREKLNMALLKLAELDKLHNSDTESELREALLIEYSQATVL